MPPIQEKLVVARTWNYNSITLIGYQPNKGFDRVTSSVLDANVIWIDLLSEPMPAHVIGVGFPESRLNLKIKR